MRRERRPMIAWLVAASTGWLLPGCPLNSTLPVDTRLAFTNLSRTFYAAFAFRAHSADGSGVYSFSPLLAPGATWRANFSDVLAEACPDGLDFRVFLYRRANADVAIGRDDTEAVEAMPVVAGEVLSIPACGIELVEDYTVVNWDAPQGQARVKFAQGTRIETAIIQQGLFPNVDAVWEVQGVDPALAATSAPALAPTESISGRVTLADGTGVENIGVLLKTRFRVRLDDNDTSNDPDVDWSDPIAVTVTDANGNFAINRPAGVYRIEIFADDYLFRPVVVDLETPQQQITIVAEPL